MGKKPLDPNAIRALNEMKMEIAKELGVTNNIFTAGPVGGIMTRRLVEMGEKDLIDEE